MRAIRVLLAAMGLALALALAACGGGSPTPATETPSPSPSASATPEVIGGVPVVPLKIGEPADFPDDVALIVETGCWQCDGPTTGLERVYRDPSGEIIIETLFTPKEMGLPPRIVQTIKGPEKDEPTINGFALTPDGDRIVVSVCTRGTCLELGGAPGPDAETTLFESLDGGVTWKQIAVLDGGLAARATIGEGVLLWDLSTPFEGEDRYAYRVYPGGEVVEAPAGSVGWRLLTTPEDEPVWPTGDGRLLRKDGSVYLSLDLPRGVEILDFVQAPGEDALSVVVWFEEGEGAEPGVYYLAAVEPDGRFRKVYRAGGLALPGGWLALLVYGNASVAPERLPVPPPDLYLGWLPAAFDIEAGEARPILDPFLDRPSRNIVQAVVEGPFARVDGTGDCLDVRSRPSAGAAVLECAADGVLLLLNRGLEDTRTEGGVTWVHVVTPAGADGWAGDAYLDR